MSIWVAAAIYSIVLSPGAGFEGNLADAEGQPLANTAQSITVTGANGQSWPLKASTDTEGHFTVVEQSPAEVVDIAIAASEGELGGWTAERVSLEANAITALGDIVFAEE